MSIKSRQRKQRHLDREAGKPVAPPPRRGVPLKMARQCGACTVCCVVYGITELDKLRGEPCHYLKPTPDNRGMCSIWGAPVRVEDGSDVNDFAGRDAETGEVRFPKACADFRCLWLEGTLPADLYPPVSNVVGRPSADGEKITFHEVVSDAARALPVADVIATFAHWGLPIVIIPPPPGPGQEEQPRRIVRPPLGKNPRFDKEIELLEHRHPGEFVNASGKGTGGNG